MTLSTIRLDRTLYALADLHRVCRGVTIILVRYTKTELVCLTKPTSNHANVPISR